MLQDHSALFRLGWSLHQRRDLDDRHWREWNRMNDELNAGTPALDSNFLRPMCDLLGDNTLQMAAYAEPGEVLVLLLIQRTRIGEWKVFCPGQACIGANMIAPALLGGQRVRILTELMRSLPGLTWRIWFPKQDTSLAQIAAADTSCFDTDEHSITTSVAVSGSFADYWSARNKRVKHTIRSAQREWQRLGTEPELIQMTGLEDMAQAVAEHGLIETAGWKGREGTAIHKDNEQGRFYRDVLEKFALKGGSVVYQLRAGKRVFASLLTIVQNGTQVVLKTTYDEGMSKLSPGRYIDYMMLGKVFDQQDVKIVENYTSSNKIDRQWATASRPILDVDFIYPEVALKAKRLFSRVRVLTNRIMSSGDSH